MKPDNEKLADSNYPYVERKIGKHLYRVTRLGWWDVQKTIESLSEILGPAISNLIGMAKAGADIGDTDVSWSAIIASVPAALASAAGEQGRALQRTFGERTIVEVDNKAVLLDNAIIDVWFSKHPAEALPWLGFSLEVHVWDFFKPLLEAPNTARRLKDIAGSIREEEAKKKAPPSPNT